MRPGKDSIGLVVALWALPALGDPAPDPCATAPIHSLRVEGCTLPACADPAFPRALADLSDFRIGETPAPGDAEKARKRLLRLGFFREVSIVCTPGPDGIDAVLTVVPSTRLAAIRFEGNRTFYDTALADRLTVQPGDALDPDDPKSTEVLDRTREAILRAYQEEGFNGTVVSVSIEPRPDGRVDLRIRVEEGERVRISGVDVSFKATRQRPPSATESEKCPVIRPGDLRRWAGISAGDAFTGKVGPDVVRRLTRTLHSIGFTGVKVLVSLEPETRRLKVDATYERCWRIGFFVRDSERPGRQGYSPLVEASLLDVLPFADSGVFDFTEASLAREDVRLYFENRGYLFADVVLDYRASDAGAVVAGPDIETADSFEAAAPEVAGAIRYFVTLGGRREIRRIRIFGNRELSDDEIREVMETKPYDFLGDTGAVLPDQVFYDLDRIEALYHDRGFPDMRCKGGSENPVQTRTTTVEGTDVVHTYTSGARAFRVRVPRFTEGVYLEIEIEEGERIRVGEVIVRGADVLAPAQRTSDLPVEPGGPFSPGRVADSERRLLQRLGGEGYLSAKVDVSCRGHEPDVPPESCDVDKIRSKRVDVVFQVTPGPRSSVGAVFVRGTQRTRDSVVLRDFPEPGQPYDVNRVAEAVRRLKDLGVFNLVQVLPVGADEKPPREKIALVVNTRESRSRFLDIGGGFETLNRSGSFPGWITSPISASLSIQDRSTTAFGRILGLQIPDVLLSAEVRYTDMNFLGRAKRLYLPVKYGLSATAWDRYASFTPSLVDPRFLVRGLTLRFTPFAVYDRATSRYDTVQLGAELALSKELFPRLFGAVSLQLAEVKTRDLEVTAKWSPFRLEGKVTPTLTYDRLDHPINPTKGGMLQASLSYINAMSSGTMNHFIKYDVTGKLFWTARRTVTFALSARYGDSSSFSGDRLPDEERFTLGGNQGVRGLTDGAVHQYLPDGTPRTDVKDIVVSRSRPVAERSIVTGGNTIVSSSAEVRFPILRHLNFNGAVFYDVGALSERISDLSAKSFRQSVGFGIRYLLGGSIPFRLDYGLVLDRRCRKVSKDVNVSPDDPGFCLEKDPIGNIHFGILYTF